MRKRDFLRLELGRPRRLSGGLCDHEHPALAPDGRHLAYYAGEYGNIAIVVTTRGGHFAFTASPPHGNSTQPSWHPDGNLLLYRHQPASDAKWELWQTALKGDLKPRQLLAHPEFHFKHPSFSPDGRRLAWFSDEGSPGIFHLWLAEVLDTQKLRAEDEQQPGSFHLFSVGVSLGKRRQLTFGRDRMDCHPVFSPDGRRMAYHYYRGTDENARPAITNLAELDVASGVIHELTDGRDQYKHPFYLDDAVLTFHHEDNTTGVRRLGAMHLPRGEVVWLSSGEKNDKHPFPWREPSPRKSKSRGRQWLYYSSKREGEEEPGEPSSYDIVRAELSWSAADDSTGPDPDQRTDATKGTQQKKKDKEQRNGKDGTDRKKHPRSERLDHEAAAGAELFARHTHGLSTGKAAAGQIGRSDDAALLNKVRREIQAGKWKKDNCDNCPFRYLNEGKIRSISEMATDKRVKKPLDTCKRCPSRPLLAALKK